MGEKEIIEDGGSTGGLVAGGGTPGVVPGTTGTPPGWIDPMGGGGGGGTPHTGGGPQGGGGGGGYPVDDCYQLEMQFKQLKDAYDAAAKANRDLGGQALDAFYGKPGDRSDFGVKGDQSLLVTEAVIDSNNAVGSALINAALAAAGGWSGVGKMAGLSGEFIEGAGTASGIITKALGTSADKATGAVLDQLGQAMKDSALEGPKAAAAQHFANFVGKATAANQAYQGMQDLQKQMKDVADKAKAKNCPGDWTVPDSTARHFDLTPAGQGAVKGQKGPTYTFETSAGTTSYDMFGQASRP